jgi:glycine hydroxymethyltransferase
LINYEDLMKSVTEFKPKLLIAGYSAYPRDLDYKKFRECADAVGAILFVDMAHYAGLVAGEQLNSPFEYADIVTTTTHKTLRGPRAGMIFYKVEYKQKIDFSVFPSLQGGPHNHQIAAIAVQLKEVNTPEYKEYAKQVIVNAKALAEGLTKRGHKLVTDGTDNHLMLIDCRPHGLTGNKVEKALDLAAITVNKNSIYGDKR